jgi:phosphatidylglycerol---prolipoprotein diacylglyceryl transferase
MLKAAIPFPDFNPVALPLGPLEIRWYALAYIAGLLGGWWYARRLLMKDALWGTTPRLKPADLDDLIVFVALGVVLGGRIGYVLFYNLDYFLRNPIEIVMIWKGGMAFHGGMIGAALALALFARRKGASILSTFDIAAAVEPIGQCLGRIANFIKPELWGRPTDVPWAVQFPLDVAGPLPRHPSQLYAAALEGVLLFLLLAIAVRMGALKRPGLVAGFFGIGYSAARIFVEFFREPDPQVGFLYGGWLTMGMVLSLPMAIIGLGLVLAARSPRSPA